MPNHYVLMHLLLKELMELAVEKRWIDNARTAAPNNQGVQLGLDRRLAEIDKREDEIHTLFFEVPRSN